MEGKPCGGYAGRESDFCLAHDPARRQAAQEARRSGGLLRPRPVQADAFLPESEAPELPKSHEDVTAIVAKTIRDVLIGRVSAQRAKVVQDLARQWMRLHPEPAPTPEAEMTDDELLAALEREADRARQRIAARKGTALRLAVGGAG